MVYRRKLVSHGIVSGSNELMNQLTLSTRKSTISTHLSRFHFGHDILSLLEVMKFHNLCAISGGDLFGTVPVTKTEIVLTYFNGSSWAVLSCLGVRCVRKTKKREKNNSEAYFSLLIDLSAGKKKCYRYIYVYIYIYTTIENERVFARDATRSDDVGTDCRGDRTRDASQQAENTESPCLLYSSGYQLW